MFFLNSYCYMGGYAAISDTCFFHYNPLLYPLFIGIAMENGSFIGDLYPNTKQ